MSRKFNSVLEGLVDYTPHKNRDHFIEVRAQQALAGIENLKKLISETYDEELSEELIKRFLLAAKSGDERKFTRKITEIRGSKDAKKK